MMITDIFIKRPVLATVVSLLIFIFGLRALLDLPVRQYPETENAVINVTTAYPGASADLIQGFITTPIQQAMASADGIDYITSESNNSLSTIKAYVKLNFDGQEAFTNIMSKVAEVRDRLPQESQQPVIQKSTEKGSALMYVAFNSDDMTPQQITDYVSRVINPKVETIAGVGESKILGGSTFSMRIWLNPVRMAAYNLTPADVSQALRQNNFQSAAGNTKGEYVAINIRANTDLDNAEAFGNIVVKTDNGSMIRIKDIARVELGAQNYDSNVRFNGKQAIFIGISATPSANPLSVIKRVRAELPNIERDLPAALSMKVVYDATKYIQSSIDEVISTILEATVIVIIVIFLFLGSIRSVMIPVVTIPLSLIGVCTLMLFLGYSINLLTLLAMVLAIGLVVDDAIVVVENIHRHIEQGMNPFQAALSGAREIALPVISMTITLAAVYAPIGFMGGLTGALFKEFAFTLASAVIISGIVALTLSPMMCSKLLTSSDQDNTFAHKLDQIFERLKQFYLRRLHNALNYRPVVVVLAVAILASLYPLYSFTPKETAPQEDVGFFIFFGTGPQYSTIDYMSTFTKEYEKIIQQAESVEDYFVINGMGTVNTALAGIIMKPWDQRNTKQDQYKQALQQKVDDIAGLKTFVAVPSPLPGGGDGAPVNFVITSTMDYRTMAPIAEQITAEAMQSGQFLFADSSLKFDKPELTMLIDRDKASQLGLSMSDIGSALSNALSGGYINRFGLSGRSYEVIPQLERHDRLNPEQLQQIYVKTASGQMIPLSTVTVLKQQAQPNSLSQFQQLNSITIQGVPRPGVSLGDALAFLESKAREQLPKGMSYDYAGQSRQFVQEGNVLLFAFFFSLIIIFLVLAAQFESFRDPLIILVSVPLSICGALIFIHIGFATINIYTQVGLITLIGLISKHGILMVDFANHLQINKGLTVRQAIEESASVRLRPILMTTAAMVFGVVPLVLASGAGAISRQNIGLVIATGMTIGTLFTLFVVPTMYTFFAKQHR